MFTLTIDNDRLNQTVDCAAQIARILRDVARRLDDGEYFRPATLTVGGREYGTVAWTSDPPPAPVTPPDDAAADLDRLAAAAETAMLVGTRAALSSTMGQLAAALRDRARAAATAAAAADDDEPTTTADALAETATATPPAGRFLHGISEATFDRLALFANPPGHLVGRAALPDVWVSDRVADRLEQYRGPGMTDEQMLNAAIDAAFGTDPRP